MRVTRFLPERYSLENARRVLRNPRLLELEAVTLATTINARTMTTLESAIGGPDGIDVVAADWDTLIVLDGCRYDLFAAHADLDGDLRAVRSRASHSGEFMEANFEGRTIHDTVYVTSNPHAYDLDDGIFHAVENVLDDRWDEDYRTVVPEAMVDAAVDAHERFPDKRLIVHFMQPHFPFLGPTGRQFDHRGIDLHLDDEAASAKSPWLALVSDPDVDLDRVLAAYRENLELVTPHVRTLADRLDGKTVVTSDHGNLLGERGFPVPVRLYGHPRGIRNENLLKVPWLELPADERRATVAEPPRETGAETDDAVVEDRLRALGYV